MKKKVFSKSFGCQMNVYDTSRMVAMMEEEGYEETTELGEADLIIVNTCHIREKAKDKLFSALGRINEQRKRDSVLVVAGCVAQAASTDVLKRVWGRDVVIGPLHYHKLPALIAAGGYLTAGGDAAEKFTCLPPKQKIKGISEYIAVQEGCDKFCSYCVVPYTRGREFSRDFNQVVEEARGLCGMGVKEITLLGQNVDNYHSGGHDLTDLIAVIANLDGLLRIRYLTSYPTQVGEHLIAAHRDIPKLMPFIHVPIQSGSDNVLRMMNRQYTSAEYIELIDRLREARPDIAVSSDFIVGFPRETEQDFKDTLKVCQQVKFASAFSFAYNPRPGTQAAMMDGQIPKSFKQSRLQTLQTLLNQQQLAFNKQFEGREVEVLIEGKSDRNDGTNFGKTPHMQTVVVEGGEIGKIIRVKISQAGMKGMEGKEV